jgi:hypothetical protein
MRHEEERPDPGCRDPGERCLFNILDDEGGLHQVEGRSVRA